MQSFPQKLSHLYTNPEFIGSGGFARVFKAKRKDGELVAVKIPLNMDENTGRSFLREITSWQRLTNRNIVRLFDANILPIPYLELEYMDGGSLEDLEKPVEIQLACELVFNIADGLRYAHDNGIIHRDLKPHNILLTKDLTPRITDWGLSKVTSNSKTSKMMGFSPLYASPEQISPSEFGRTDERSDIFQLGVIFYELVTGKLPFTGDSFVEIASSIINKEPVPISNLNAEAKEIENIIIKCLSKKQGDRYQNISEFLHDLAGFIKKDYIDSLKTSLGSGDIKRSAFYCAELCLVQAKLGDQKEALKFALDLKQYAGEEVKKDVDMLIEELKLRTERDLRIDDQLFNKMEVLIHQVKIGRKKIEKKKIEKTHIKESGKQCHACGNIIDSHNRSLICSNCSVKFCHVCEGWFRTDRKHGEGPLCRECFVLEKEKSLVEPLHRLEHAKSFINSIGMIFILIPKGEFIMGSNEYDDQKPAHKVKIKKPFYLGIYPVTQREWKMIMNSNPSQFKGDDLPVEKVSWKNVQDFIKKLNNKESTDKYRLPTEAEWEYSTRAGTSRRYFFGNNKSKLDEYAWYAENSGSRSPLKGDYLGYDKKDWEKNNWGGKTHPVGMKKPNNWGLFDLYGNVWEWVEDKWNEGYDGAPSDGTAWENGDKDLRVCRGGGWCDMITSCQSAFRIYFQDSKRADDIGFRVLREI